MNKKKMMKFKKQLNMNINIPSPMNITLMWNFGSLLGICLMFQLMTGMLLAFRYSADVMLAFNSVNMIMNETWNGYMLRNMHANGASMFFIFLFTHIGRGMYFKSYTLYKTWSTGVIIFLMVMATAFLGYVLPWGQMSYWGSTVITNLISSIPYIGEYLVMWIWSSYSVDNSTLTRFFCLHFILPFVIMMLVMIHLFYLHNTGSNNPMGLNSNNSKISFNPYFILKDLMGIFMFMLILLFIVLWYPYMLGDADNFILANSMITPEHIQPEWYFLFAYAILRSIPSKLGGVIALLMSICILFFMPLLNMSNLNSIQFYPISKILFITLFTSVIMLTWIGMKPVEIPYIKEGQILSIIYFSLYFMIPIIEYWFDKMMN